VCSGLSILILTREEAAQRLALAAWWENQLTKRKMLSLGLGFLARPTTKSAARLVGQHLWFLDPR
jgi:hypothetical protein